MSQEWNPAFKGPETIDTALDPLHEKIHTDLYAKATEGVYIPPDTNRPIDKFLQPNATVDEERPRLLQKAQNKDSDDDR